MSSMFYISEIFMKKGSGPIGSGQGSEPLSLPAKRWRQTRSPDNVTSS
jgi:hypothetical protein